VTNQEYTDMVAEIVDAVLMRVNRYDLLNDQELKYVLHDDITNIIFSNSLNAVRDEPRPINGIYGAHG